LTDKEYIVPADNSGEGLISTSLDAITDFVSGSTIPAPIKRNALKAFSQLCTAAIEIPVAYLEGIAAEKRAESEARVKIITASADQIASQVSVDPAYARAAVKKYGQKIIRERVNLDMVSEVAAEELKKHASLSEPTNSDQPISDDWLNQFEREASQKSTEEMQLLFGRILAGEIQNPSSFSIRTVKLLGALDSQSAILFKRLCSLSMVLRGGNHVIDARVSSLGGNASSNSLLKYGLGFDQLNILHEYGLIIPDYNSYFDYRIAIADQNNQVTLGFQYQGNLWGLVAVNERPVSQAFLMYGVSLSRAGRELLSVVDIDSADDYTSALQEFFTQQNLKIVPVLSPQQAAT
jgi:Protein of unknown function (DUF2806)